MRQIHYLRMESLGALHRHDEESYRASEPVDEEDRLAGRGHLERGTGDHILVHRRTGGHRQSPPAGPVTYLAMVRDSGLRLIESAYPELRSVD